MGQSVLPVSGHARVGMCNLSHRKDHPMKTKRIVRVAKPVTQQDAEFAVREWRRFDRWIVKSRIPNVQDVRTTMSDLLWMFIEERG